MLNRNVVGAKTAISFLFPASFAAALPVRSASGAVPSRAHGCGAGRCPGVRPTPGPLHRSPSGHPSRKSCRLSVSRLRLPRTVSPVSPLSPRFPRAGGAGERPGRVPRIPRGPPGPPTGIPERPARDSPGFPRLTLKPTVTASRGTPWLPGYGNTRDCRRGIPWETRVKGGCTRVNRRGYSGGGVG